MDQRGHRVVAPSWPPQPPKLERRSGAPGRIRTADAGLRTAALYPLSYGGVRRSYPKAA